ncbi:DEAD/DEAH box helicase [Parasynechococcus marenigrum]|uniref:SNF2 helicase homolog n=1 Tax=Parasynechococcus marenigrum (strain WH8102) TaxID=84588 RepID=Q7U3R7_PARMW|nr:DEAD/DEAH box helicase [Parasynechococcus marenigrum]CAE08877.1 SNF2 helicase homolog [Parasynechococcus marenigrum WH 8102]
MSLLHATWLPAIRTSGSSGQPALLIWADTWRVATPEGPGLTPALHPFTLEPDDLKAWLQERDLLPGGSIDATACLTLPSRTVKPRKSRSKTAEPAPEEPIWTGLPMQAGEPIPKQTEWWPWQVQGLAVEPSAATEWLSRLPLSGRNPDLADELRWWSHLQRWALSLVARGRWIPQMELSKGEGYPHRARWVPLLNREEDRRRLEDLAASLPLVATCALPWREPMGRRSNRMTRLRPEAMRAANPVACCRPRSGRLRVATLLEDLVDAQLRKDFEPSTDGLDPLLTLWQDALGSETGVIEIGDEQAERLASASFHWREGIAGDFAAARTCLELQTPAEGEELWELRFGLQAESDPSLKLPAAAAWASGADQLQLGEVTVEQPGEVLLEGLGRALTVFPPIERGLETATPDTMQLTPAEAFVLVRTAARQLRDAGVGVDLPPSLSGGLASRLGLAIKAELPERSSGFSLGESLDWSWDLMIGGVTLTLRELERLSGKRSPLVRHKGAWIELRPNDLRNAERFCGANPELSLDDALRITATEGDLLMRLPVHRFEAGPRLQAVLEQYHQQKAPDPLPAPEGFCGQLRPYQERGLGWLAFLNRFDQGACLADDMGLGKTIQLLAFLQHLKAEQELKRPVLLVAPTSVLTNWRREAEAFTPELAVREHYGPRRPSTPAALKKALKDVDLVLTSYGLLQRDSELLESQDWQGVVIDEAQAIKNPSAKQSQAARDLARPAKGNRFRIALTGTPVENRVSELWALMDFLSPKVLGEEDFFRQRYRMPIERYGDMASLRDLKARVGPFILRRLKTDKTIISDLPEKVELSEWVGLSKEQKSLYSKTVEDTLDAIARAPRGQRHGQVLGLLTRLKQICNHPALALSENAVDDGFLGRSAKLQRLEEILDEVIEAGDRALLFTQFAEWGHLLQSWMQQRWKADVPFLHGGTRKNERQAMVDRFQEDPRGPQLFLLSLKAGGVGLNLTRASHVFHIDRWWNPAVENQATDRAYRIGQTNRVMVHKFITSGSVEEKIDRMIREKSRLAEDVIGSGEDWLGCLAGDQLRNLVALEDT